MENVAAGGVLALNGASSIFPQLRLLPDRAGPQGSLSATSCIEFKTILIYTFALYAHESDYCGYPRCPFPPV
jgi:hypothetical protein